MDKNKGRGSELYLTSSLCISSSEGLFQVVKKKPVSQSPGSNPSLSLCPKLIPLPQPQTTLPATQAQTTCPLAGAAYVPCLRFHWMSFSLLKGILFHSAMHILMSLSREFPPAPNPQCSNPPTATPLWSKTCIYRQSIYSNLLFHFQLCVCLRRGEAYCFGLFGWMFVSSVVSPGEWHTWKFT